MGSSASRLIDAWGAEHFVVGSRWEVNSLGELVPYKEEPRLGFGRPVMSLPDVSREMLPMARSALVRKAPIKSSLILIFLPLIVEVITQLFAAWMRRRSDVAAAMVDADPAQIEPAIFAAIAEGQS